MSEQPNEKEFADALKGTISREDKQLSMLNICSLMASATVVGAYAGYMLARGQDLSTTAKVALGVPMVLSGLYLSLCEPKSTSDVERISESRVEIIELGEMSKLERILAAGAGSGFAAATTAMGYAIGYGLGSVVERL